VAFELRPLERDQWGVYDEQDRLRWSGSLRDCEDWLDRDENAARGERRGLLRRMMDYALRRNGRGS
jgi:hypothetical protein